MTATTIDAPDPAPDVQCCDYPECGSSFEVLRLVNLPASEGGPMWLCPRHYDRVLSEDEDDE